MPASNPQPLPPSREEWLSLREAAELFDPPSSKKALEGLIDRGKLRYAKEGTGSGRASRRITTRAWLEEYVAQAGGRARLKPSDVFVVPRRPHAPPPSGQGGDFWRRMAEEQAIEILRLRARIDELEARLR